MKAQDLRRGDVILVGPTKRRLMVDHLVTDDHIRINGQWAEPGDGPDAAILRRYRNTVEVTVHVDDEIEMAMDSFTEFMP